MAEPHRDRVKKEFSKQVSTLANATFFTDQEIIEKIKTTADLTHEMTVLDAGCGPGILTETLAPLVHKIVAYDLTPEMVEAAETRCKKAELSNVEYRIGTIESLPYENEHFDRVITRLVVHHLPEPSKGLEEMHRVLKKNGKLILADIISAEDPKKNALHNALEVLRDPSHTRMLPLTELEKSLEGADFTIIREDSWVKKREYSEWIAISNSPERVAPLKTIMNALASTGIDAGVNLRSDADTVTFEHRWVMITASKK